MNALKLLPLSLCLFAAALHAQSLPPESQFGTSKYVEYIPGDLPLIFTSPHGGALKPESLPNRTYGVLGADANTQELTRAAVEQLFIRTGRRAHLVMSHLHRSKLDPNREIKEAAQGNPDAQRAWNEYHAFIEKAREAAVKRHGYAFLIDMHGQNHKGERIELGYLFSPQELAVGESLNNAETVAKSSLALLVKRSGQKHTDLISGPKSLGALLAARGWRTTPSPQMPVPDEPYYKGGYTVARHCKDTTTGLQLEANRTRLRDTAANRAKFIKDFVPVLIEYLNAHLALKL